MTAQLPVNSPPALETLLQALTQLLQPQQPTMLVVALSGGLDSMLLLDLVSRLEWPVRKKAVHVHHGLSPQADSWGQFCQAQCQQRGIEFAIEYVQLDDQTRNIEAQARSLRYGALLQHLQPGGFLLTAHHADDQLETLLLALKRGSGLDGLTGIAQQKSAGQGQLVRPLLAFSRQELWQVAHSVALAWIEDESNNNQDFDRNFLRHQILPLLHQRFARFSQNASRSAQLLQQSQQWQQQQLQAHFLDVVDGERLDLTKLRQFDGLTQTLLLRAFAKQHQLILSQQQVQILQSEVIAARPDAAAQLQLGSWVFRRYQQSLYLQPITTAPFATEAVAIHFQQRLDTAEAWYYWSDEAPDWLGADAYQCMPLCVLPDATLYLQAVPMSMMFKPHARPTKPMKQWCQLWQIPPWQRQRLQALTAEGQILAVVGYASACSEAAARTWLWQGPLSRALDDSGVDLALT